MTPTLTLADSVAALHRFAAAAMLPEPAQTRIHRDPMPTGQHVELIAANPADVVTWAAAMDAPVDAGPGYALAEGVLWDLPVLVRFEDEAVEG